MSFLFFGVPYVLSTYFYLFRKNIPFKDEVNKRTRNKSAPQSNMQQKHSKLMPKCENPIKRGKNNNLEHMVV